MNKQQILNLIDKVWRFDNNQIPQASWHDKQYLLEALNKELDDFADTKATSFAEWMREYEWDYFAEKWLDNKNKHFTTSELYQLFLAHG